MDTLSTGQGLPRQPFRIYRNNCSASLVCSLFARALLSSAIQLETSAHREAWNDPTLSLIPVDPPPGTCAALRSPSYARRLRWLWYTKYPHRMPRVASPPSARLSSVSAALSNHPNVLKRNQVRSKYIPTSEATKATSYMSHWILGMPSSKLFFLVDNECIAEPDAASLK